MSAIASYQQFADTIEIHKNRVEQLREENQKLKKLLGTTKDNNQTLVYGLDELEYKLGQYQEAAWKLCQAIYYEQSEENQLAHSTRECISGFMSLWINEDKRVFNETFKITDTSIEVPGVEE